MPERRQSDGVEHFRASRFHLLDCNVDNPPIIEFEGHRGEFPGSGNLKHLLPCPLEPTKSSLITAGTPL